MQKSKSTHDRIKITAGKRSGQPCIRDTRITVTDVLSYLSAGMGFDEILNDFPDLEKADIVAALEFSIQKIKP